MGQPQGQLNPYIDNSEIILRASIANGTVNDAVMRFTNLLVSTGTTGMAAADSVTLGTQINVWRSGIYRVTCAFSQVALVTANVGISLNATNVTGEPVAGAGGVLTAVLATTPAATVIDRSVSYDVHVRPQDIVAQVGITNRWGVIRIHLTNGAGATGEATITAATAQVQISRVIGLG